jgi:hypothetical protein
MPINVLTDSAHYPHIPVAVIKHAQLLEKASAGSRFLDALASEPEATAAAIDSMFERAAQATGQTPDQVLAGTGFNRKDTNPARIDAAFAEVRTINILDAQGFSGINQITAGAARAADLVATRGGLRYAVEVADSVFHARGRFSPSQISGWIVERYQAQGKGVQLANTASQLGCQRRMFAGVMDTAATVALQEAPEFRLAAETAWGQLGRDPTLHIAILTGRVSAFQGPDDSVYPPWP